MTNSDLQKLLKQYPDDVQVIVYTHLGEEGGVAGQTHIDTIGEDEVYYAGNRPVECSGDLLENGDKVVVVSCGYDYKPNQREQHLTP